MIGWLVVIGVLIVVFESPAHAHNTSVTWIDVKIAPPHMTITLNLNQSDLLEHVLDGSPSQARFADRRELEDAASKLLAYVIENLRVSVDGKPLGPPTAPSWPPLHAELTHLDANGLETPSFIPLRLDYRLPANARHIEIRPNLYATPNFAAIFDVSISTPGMTKPVMSIVDKHQPITFDLDKSPILERNSSLPTRKLGSRFWVTINVLLAAAVVTVWRWRRTWHSR